MKLKDLVDKVGKDRHIPSNSESLLRRKAVGLGLIRDSEVRIDGC